MQKCPVCQNERGREIGVKNDFQILACTECKSLHAGKMSAEQKLFSYDDYYHEENVTVPDFVHLRLSEIVGEFAPFRQNNRLLDVGCGAGVLLLAAKKADWNVEGVEVSKPSVEHLQKKGFKIFHGTLQEANYSDNYFDVVTSVEVLEHVTEPKNLVEEIYRILRPGGLFWGTTPHGRGFSSKAIGMDWSAIAPPEHLQLFSVSGIKTMFEQAGFSQVKINTSAVNPFELITVWRKKLSKVSNKKETVNTEEQNFNGTQSGYELNESFTKSPLRKSLKNVLNGILNFTQLGDSIKFWAVK